jgi:hypothetical protein
MFCGPPLVAWPTAMATVEFTTKAKTTRRANINEKRAGKEKERNFMERSPQALSWLNPYLLRELETKNEGARRWLDSTFPGTPGQAGNKNRSEKIGMFFAARKTSVDSPQFTHDVISKNPRSASCLSQNLAQKATRSRQIINPQKSTTDPITIAQ